MLEGRRLGRKTIRGLHIERDQRPIGLSGNVALENSVILPHPLPIVVIATVERSLKDPRDIVGWLSRRADHAPGVTDGLIGGWTPA
jgi:hypothetical protein